MADRPDVERIKEELEKDTRDVADLWNEALRNYKGIVGEDLVPKYKSVDEMIQAGTEQMNAFHKFRHNEKKVDKLRSLFMSNLDYIEQGAQQIVAAATPAFPPAAAIGTALTYVLSACKQVSADYDVVTAFFEDLNTFFQRITILESRLPSYPAYRNCLMDVFTSVLVMCGFATKYIQLRRFKKWLLNMIRGEDGELAAARKAMDEKLSHLQSATEYAILGNTEKLQTMSAELKQNDEMQTQMLEEQTKMLETVIEGQDNVRNDLKDIRKLLSVFQEQKREETQVGTQKSARSKPPTSSRVRAFFLDLIDPTHEYRVLKDSLIPEMSTWIFDEPEWTAWLGQSSEKNRSKLLYIAGPPGTGKSHLAVAAHDRLVQLGDRNTCVVRYYFRETRNETRCFLYAMNWLIIQIAEYNDHFCEKINAELSREDLFIGLDDWEGIWTKMIAPLFPQHSPYRLQIVLDGLDELSPDGVQRVACLKFLKLVKESDTNVTVLSTTRSGDFWSTFPAQLDEMGSKKIMLTKEKQLSDLKTLTWHHLDNDVGLKNLSQYMRLRISSTLEEKADCLLYTEHILRRFNHLRREPLILRHLEKEMPNNLEELYNSTLSDLVRKNSPEQRQALRILFSWLAFATRPITLYEATCLMKLVPGDFDLEEELQGQDLSRLLQIADRTEEVDLRLFSPGKDIEDIQEQGSSHEGASDDWNLPLKFQERSLRDYFRAAKLDEDPASLRTTGFEAHRQIFISLSRTLGKPPGIDCSDGLRSYAATTWYFHFVWVWWYRSLGRPTDEHKIELLDAMGAIFNADGHTIENIENLGVFYEELAIKHLHFKLQSLAQMARDVGEGKLKESTTAWIDEASNNWQKAFLGLAKAHIHKLFSATESKSAVKTYWFARSCLSFTELKSLLEECQWNENTMEKAVTSTEIAAVFKAFPNTTNHDPSLALALVLFDYGHYNDALPEAQKALEFASSDPVKRLQAGDLLARVHYGLSDYRTAYNTINSVLDQTVNTSPALIRRALVTRANVESAQGMIDKATASYQAARLAQPETPMLGGDLQKYFAFMKVNMDDEPMAIIRILESWSPIDRLAWMTWKYDDDGADHTDFQRICGRANQTEFMVATYEETIRLLDTVNAGAPLRLNLAHAQWKVCGDLVAAKELLNEVLDSTSDGSRYRFTDMDAPSLLVDSINTLTDVFYEEFRKSSDPKQKTEIIEATKNMLKKPLAHSISSWRSMHNHHRLVLARMVKVMGPRMEYQDMLQAVFDIAYEALFDNVNWNDSENLRALAMVLSIMGGFEEEARILASAVFSIVDKVSDDTETGKCVDRQDGQERMQKDSGIKEDVTQGGTGDFIGTKGEHNAESEDDNSNTTESDTDDSLPSDEGDLDGRLFRACDGECQQVHYRSWRGRTLYFCTICADVDLCDVCFEKRQEYNKDASSLITTVGAEYCGANHKYLKGPLEGWQGVKNGMIMIEGKRPVAFKDWLEELKDVKWKEAWDRFWLAED